MCISLETKEESNTPGRYTIINICDEPGGIKKKRLENKEQEIIIRLKRKILIDGDINAKNEAWGREVSDERREDFMNWATVNNFFLENQRSDSPSFIGVNMRSCVDMTMTRDMKIEDRRVGIEETKRQTDHIRHKWITYDTPVQRTREEGRSNKRKRTKYDIKMGLG